jgi:hypothetical protein
VDPVVPGDVIVEDCESVRVRVFGEDYYWFAEGYSAPKLLDEDLPLRRPLVRARAKVVEAALTPGYATWIGHNRDELFMDSVVVSHGAIRMRAQCEARSC